uniref:T-cell receptor alpha/delta variable 29.0 n=1 Tax=Cyprinus carpio TaxID=7962 RepID=A0A8C1UBA7_CYPCA
MCVCLTLLCTTNSVTQPRKVQTATAGETVTIDCTYKTNAFPTLYWYQYKVNQAPKYMLKRYAGSSDEDEDFKERFNATLQTSSTSVSLTIHDVRVSDSAVYYCDAGGEGIAPLSSSKLANNGDSITLTCNYNGSYSSDSLLWYRQYSSSKPQFLFLVSESKLEQPISSASVSDSAMYYCALQPTVTGNTSTLYKIKGKTQQRSSSFKLCLSDTEANAIIPLLPIMSTVVGENVTISYSYKGFTGRVLNAQWYRQYDGSKPVFRTHSYSHKGPDLPITISRFSGKFDQDLQQVDLQISKVFLTDSAVYYCALQPTITGN